MEHLTQQELNFWNALIDDYNKRENKSFLYTLFLGFNQPEETLKEGLFDLYTSKQTRNFLSNCDLLLETENGVYIGKYKEFYFLADTEGDIRGVGQQIQNIPANRINEEINDLEDQEALKLFFEEEYQLDYKDYINSYKVFCQSFNLEYSEDLNLIEKQSIKFNEFIKSVFNN